MKLGAQNLRLAATDLSNHLACRHLTTLDLCVARGKKLAPEFHSPDLQVIRELGLRLEGGYLDSLRGQGLEVVDLREVRNDEHATAVTVSYLKKGVDAIAQAPLARGRWFGRADVLWRVTRPFRELVV